MEKEEYSKFMSRSSVFPCKTFRSLTNASFLNLGCLQYMNLEKDFLRIMLYLTAWLFWPYLFVVKRHSRVRSKPKFVKYGPWKQRKKFWEAPKKIYVLKESGDLSLSALLQWESQIIPGWKGPPRIVKSNPWVNWPPQGLNLDFGIINTLLKPTELSGRGFLQAFYIKTCTRAIITPFFEGGHHSSIHVVWST